MLKNYAYGVVHKNVPSPIIMDWDVLLGTLPLVERHRDGAPNPTPLESAQSEQK